MLRTTSGCPVNGWTPRRPPPAGGAAVRDGGRNAVRPPGGSTGTGFSGRRAHPHPAPVAITPNGRPYRVKVW
ncbi:hypothetical protein ACFY00_26000 [Kitasatospora sp. NPDC001540]|uniref:hypothetical protein n=1 Tax=Kitasatospora sp. NPDC001540 TaxID=3364014 RepID=UPI0036BC0C81